MQRQRFVYPSQRSQRYSEVTRTSQGKRMGGAEVTLIEFKCLITETVCPSEITGYPQRIRQCHHGRKSVLMLGPEKVTCGLKGVLRYLECLLIVTCLPPEDRLVSPGKKKKAMPWQPLRKGRYALVLPDASLLVLAD